MLAGVTSPVAAQPYPPGPCTNPSANFAGTFAIGSTVRFTVPPVCAWDPGATVAVTVNGVTVPGKVASANGTTTVLITIVSATELSIDDQILAPARCGTNTIVGVASSSAARGPSTHTTTFNIDCPGAKAAKPSRGGVALTGANVARWSAIALGLVLVGGLFLALDRRKHRPTG